MTRRKKTTWLILGCLMVAALVLSSCTAASEEQPAQTVTGTVTQPAATTTTPTTTDTTPTTTTPVAAVDTGPKYGGKLVIAMGAGPRSFDPSNTFYSTGWYMNQVYERLLMGDLDAGPRGTDQFPFAYWCAFPDTVVEGSLAESWEVIDNPLSVVFHLREGIMWQDIPPTFGREFVAQDVVESYQWWQFDRPEASAAQADPAVASVEALDKYTVRFNLNRWIPDWMWDFGWGLFTIVPKEVTDAGIDDWRNAAGTGPFILDDFVPDVAASYVRNPNYWGSTVIDGKEYEIPFIDTLQYVNISDSTIANAAFRTGQTAIQWAVGYDAGLELEATAPGVLRLDYLDSNTNHLTINTEVAPFDDLRVRKALNMAIDRDALLEAFGGGAILNYPAKSSSPAYTPIEDLPADVAENLTYDPVRARELLTDAGYPNGFETKILIQNSGWEPKMSMIANDWTDIGVITTLDLQVQPAFNDVVFGHNYEGVISVGLGGCSIWCILNTLGYVDRIDADTGETFRDWRSGYTNNWDDTVFNDLHGEALLETDLTRSMDLLKQANYRVLEDLPIMLLPTHYVSQFWWPWVKNYYGENATGYFAREQIYATLWIDEDLKKEMGHD
ncbi:MAG: ABC transporter substrate-binding protein [Dehalococcoidia bacterium]